MSFLNHRTLLVALLAASCCVAGCASRGDKSPTSQFSRAGIARDDTTFAAGAKRSPSAATAYSLSKILISQGRDRDAMNVLTRVLRERPDFVPAYNELAGIYLRSDRLDDAVAVLRAGLKRSPNDAVLHNNLGMCYFLRADHARALESFTQAADRAPSNPVYRANRAAALGMLGREDDATSEYLSVVDTGTARHNLAVLAQARAKGEAHSSQPQAEAPTAATTRPTDASSAVLP